MLHVTTLWRELTLLLRDVDVYYICTTNNICRTHVSTGKNGGKNWIFAKPINACIKKNKLQQYVRS